MQDRSMASFSQFLLEHPEIQAWIFALAFIGFWAGEAFRFGGAGSKLRHTARNATWLIGVLPAQFVVAEVLVFAADWASREHIGLANRSGVDNASPWLWVALFLFLDLADYLYHRAAHTVPALWRFHRTHHEDTAVDVSTTFRENPGETLLHGLYGVAVVMALGAPMAVLMLRQTAQTFSNIWGHTRILPGRGWSRALGAVLVTPDHHAVHHHARLPHTNSNYGDVLIIWDRLFGTLSRLPVSQVRFGLDEDDASADARPMVARG